MRGLRSVLVAGATVALGCLLPGIASAQGYGYGYGAQSYGYGAPRLSRMAAELGYQQEGAYQSDRHLARQAQATALSYPQIKYVIRWSNPETGNRGETFVAGEGRDAAGHVCRDMRETLHIFGRSIINTGLACYVNGRWSTVG